MRAFDLRMGGQDLLPRYSALPKIEDLDRPDYEDRRNRLRVLDPRTSGDSRSTKRGEEFKGNFRMVYDTVHPGDPANTMESHEIFGNNKRALETYIAGMANQMAEQGFLVTPYRGVSTWKNGRYS